MFFHTPSIHSGGIIENRLIGDGITKKMDTFRVHFSGYRSDLERFLYYAIKFLKRKLLCRFVSCDT